MPTAVSGQWIETFLQGGIHHQNILDKIQIAAGVENARFSGIIFHQGESNNGDVSWPGKVRLTLFSGQLLKITDKHPLSQAAAWATCAASKADGERWPS